MELPSGTSESVQFRGMADLDYPSGLDADADVGVHDGDVLHEVGLILQCMERTRQYLCCVMYFLVARSLEPTFLAILSVLYHVENEEHTNYGS